MNKTHQMVRTPRSERMPWADALALTEEQGEPLFVPCETYCDDRGWSLMNLFAGAMSDQGQVNFSVQYPGVIKAWHRHQRQTDFWCCLYGHLKVGVYREEDETAWSIVIGEKRMGVLLIPPPLWHGATTVGPQPAGLLYYVTQRFDPARPDEDRRAFDSVPGFAWGVANR